MNFLWLLPIAATLAAAAEPRGRVVCYYSSWAVYRQGEAKFNVENIDPTLCSHLVYAFAQLTFAGELKEYDAYNDIGDEWHEGQFTKLQRLRPLSPDLKILIAVGGWNHGPGNFQATVVDPVKRQTWVDTTVEFCKKYGFDGMDIDWEYQDSIGGTPEVLEGFNEVLRMFRKRFDEEGLIISSATQANNYLMEVDYDMKVLSETLDFINLMAYDLHGAWESWTGCHSALHALESEQGYDTYLNLEYIVRKYISLGADPAKINIGLPTYGRGFTLKNATNSEIYANTTGPSAMGVFVPEAGILGYVEICRNRWPEFWQVEQLSPYAVKGDQWVCYDNMVSLAGKMAFLRTLGVKNYMIWSVETDDWTGQCYGQTYPLLRAINRNA